MYCYSVAVHAAAGTVALDNGFPSHLCHLSDVIDEEQEVEGGIFLPGTAQSTNVCSVLWDFHNGNL